MLGQMHKDRLLAALTKIDFEPDEAKACAFAPGIEYRFASDGAKIALGVCFDCNDVAFIGGDGKLLSRIVGFGAAEAEMLGVAQTLFPSDAQIQALRAHRGRI